MERKQVSVLITVVVMLIVTFDCGNCSIHEKIGKVESISSVTRLEDFESVLLRGSRSVHRSRRSVLNSTEQPVALDEHNRLRRLEGASNMELMIWDNDLASEAENSANKCFWNHSNTYYGQNLYATDDYRPINLTAAIEAWYAEKPNYSTYLSTGQCNPPEQPCLHYSQVVWAASRKLGCAYTRCTTLFGAYEANALFLVCNYDPPGNVVGEAPFATGSACTQCASGSWWCNNGLCDQSCTETGYTCACNPVCQNSASVNRVSCSCRRSVLNSTEQPEALGTHNRLRRLEGASNMELMIWDNDLASKAENSANKCIWNHSNTYYGQNMYSTTDPRPINLTAAIEAWYKEKPNYSTYLSTGKCNPPDQPCLHYSQVVWAASKKLGCAYTRCAMLSGVNEPNTLFLVCNYDPPGNVVGEAPFATGSACTQCASGSWWCNNGLCDQSCTETGYTCACNLACQNSASVNRASCSCSCAPGWYGTDCSAVCENKDPLCDPKPGQSGFPPSYCTRDDYGSRVRVLCPKMCGQCKDCSALICHNSGTVNIANCSCSCAPGWRGSDCSVSCIDFDSRCNPKAGEYGWPPSYCSHGQYGATVRKKCPAMCNQCPAVCVDYDSRCDPQPGEYGWPSSYCTHSEYGNATRRFCPAMCKVCQAGGKSNYDVSTSTRALLLSMLTVWMFRSTC